MHLMSATLCIAATVGACVPFPHSGSRVPELDGTVTSAGKPIAGAILLACAQEDRAAVQDCSKSAGTTTDFAGRFHLARIPKFEWLYAVYGDYFAYGYYVNIDYEGAQLTSFVSEIPTHVPDHEDLDCQISRTGVGEKYQFQCLLHRIR